MESRDTGESEDCAIRLRKDPQRRKERVLVGCGAGFGGDRSLAALKLLQKVDQLDYLVLECLAERTLADRYQIMMSGGDGFDPRITEWMSLLLPLSIEKGVCIITNMGAVDPLGAQKAILELAKSMSLDITVSVVNEIVFPKSAYGTQLPENAEGMTKGVRCKGISTYMGAAPIVQCLEKYSPDVVVTSRVADAALFLAPMVYELGWNWNDHELLAKGSLAGHLLECGCQLTGGYFMHPGDEHRNLPIPQLLDLSLPCADISFEGEICLGKAAGSGGVLNTRSCTQQLLYEIGDPSAYITPDIIIDLRDVYFEPLSADKVLCCGAKPSAVSAPEKLLRLVPKECGWKGWGEISYGGHECVKRAEAASMLVVDGGGIPGVEDRIFDYVIGLDSLKMERINGEYSSATGKTTDVRLRMDGLFETEEQASHFAREFMALYTNGPAGGGGISTGHKKEITLFKELVCRESVIWQTSAKRVVSGLTKCKRPTASLTPKVNEVSQHSLVDFDRGGIPAPSGERIPLYRAAHCRTGDKGNDLNFSVIPHFHGDLERLKEVITPDWVKRVFSQSQRLTEKSTTVDIYEVRGVSSLNVVVRNVLDGGVNCSRRIDRHGKTLSDLILSQEIVLP